MSSTMSHIILPSVSFLSSKRIFDFYLKGKNFSNEEIRQELFLAQRELRSTLPNIIYENDMDIRDYDVDSLYDIFHKSIRSFENFFHSVNNEIYIERKYFEQWQNTLTFLNPIPLIVSYIYTKKLNINIKNVFEYSSLPSLDIQYLNERQFKELHIHINGTSEIIYNWLYILKNQHLIYEMVKKSFEKNNLQYKQLGITDKGELSRILERAACVREFLSDYVRDDTLDSNLQYKKFEEWKDYLRLDSLSEKPYKSIGVSQQNNTLIDEAGLWFCIYDKFEHPRLNESKKENFTYLVHYYMLSMSLFNKFLVQQLDQFGFDQFQLITDNKLRDGYEDGGFKERYLQLKGMYSTNEDLEHLELRFAPKTNIKKLSELYKRMIMDHKCLWGAGKDKVNYKITTVAHFIKQKNTSNKKGSLSCGWAEQRKALVKQADVLISMFESSNIKLFKPKINYLDYFVGIDAAGNELYARPEVFAPAFTYLRKEFKRRFNKRLNITFHAGEDFVHLVSGVRYIYETVCFLDMDKLGLWEKKRIGHATALGIHPKFWMEKLDKVLVMKQGEYLDNMIFIKRLLNDSRYDQKIKDFWKEVYGNRYNNQKAWKAWEARKEDPYECKNETIALYNSYDVTKKYNKLIEVYIDKDDIDLMVNLQRKVLEILKKNKIAIESMITSNVRISYYSKYEEHHIYRWLFPERDEKDIIPPIVLACDDPGLFNNNMRIEYCHLYELLKKKDINEKDIKKKIDILHHNSEKNYFQSIDLS